MDDLERLRQALAEARTRVEALQTAIRVVEELRGVARSTGAIPLLTVRRTAVSEPARQKKLGGGATRANKIAVQARLAAILRFYEVNPGWHRPTEIAVGIGAPVKLINNHVYRLVASGAWEHDRDTGGYRPKPKEN